jgi:putative transferase (TIGR04331 family)
MTPEFRDELASITAEASKAYYRLIGPVAEMLNLIHERNYSVRYWQVLCGPWLRSFLFVYFDRSSGLRTGRYVPKPRVDKEAITLEVSRNFFEYMKNVESDYWNDTFIDILSSSGGKSLPVTLQTGARPSKTAPGSFLRRMALQTMDLWNWAFGPHHNSVFIATYLPLADDLKTQIRMKQVPTNHLQSVTTNSTETVDHNWRLDSTNEELLDLIRLFLPRSYVEDFKLLIQDSRLKNFPKKPKRIFTSNAFWFDEVFKAYMAQTCELGTKLVIGQHGGVFGTAEHSASEDHQLEIADRYISYGWTRDGFETKMQAVGNFKSAGLKLKRKKESDKALVVLTAAPTYPRFATGGPMTDAEWHAYVAQQVDFVQRLDEKAKSKILLRLKPNAFGLDQVAPWKGIVQNSSMNLGVGSLNSLLTESQLVIVTYEGTTHLDTFLLGIPTVLLLDKPIWPLRQAARQLYERLEAAGILFYDSKKAAEHVESILATSVDHWWNSKETQSAVRDFCEVFSRPMPNVSREMAATLMSLA